LAYLKVFLFAVLGAVAAAFLWIFVSFVLPMAMPMFIARFWPRPGAGGGVAGAYITSDSVLLAAAAGFAVAGGWAFRRFCLRGERSGR
jgi:hypothetical protein